MNLVGDGCGVTMDRGIIFVLFVCMLAKSLQKDIVQNADHDYEDDHYDDPGSISDLEEIEEVKNTTVVPAKPLKEVQTVNIKSPENEVKREREELTTPKQVGKYEVTELVEDIPDMNTRRTPIITNFTLTRPLNLAGTSKNETNNVRTNVIDDGDEIINSILISTIPKDRKNNKGSSAKDVNTHIHENVDDDDDDKDDDDEKDFFSNFSPESSFEAEFDKEFGSDVHDFDEDEPKPKKGFKDHFHNFKKTIVNEFKSVVNKHKDGIHDSLRKIVNGPVSFFSKLHTKSTDLAKKLHQIVTRHKSDDQDDNHDYHGLGHDIDD